MRILQSILAGLHIAHLKQDIDQYLASVMPEMVDKAALKEVLVDKWSIKPSLAEKLVDILSYMKDKDEIRTDDIIKAMHLIETTAKRYLRQLTEFGYLRAFGGNRNRFYKKRLLP
ncbi:MAG: hypothetical protein ACI4CA_01060 [Bacteroides sp.]